MKELLMKVVSDNSFITVLSTGLAYLLVLGIQFLIERIQNQTYRTALQKVVPLATELFFYVEKEVAKKKLSKSYQEKALLFEKKFKEEFYKLWGREPKAKEISIAKDVVGSLVAESKKVPVDKKK